MNPKYNRHVDIFMESYKKAIAFGRKEAKVQVLTEKDTQKKVTTNKKESKKKVNKKSKQKSHQANLHTPWAPSVLKPQAKP
jgi:hypothetical protein